MLHHQPQILSPLNEMDSQSNSSSLRARKMSSGGNRSWSEEEENYLLQTRMQKMPYKHIAAHLKKTELACRLHYHQLSHGSHRRKRTSSVSSTASSNSAGQSPAYSMAVDHDDYSQSSRHASPMSYTSGSPHIRASSVSASPNRNQHKILLPKPHPMTPRESPEPLNALRINTEVAHQPKVVDTERLRSIYEARRQQFWATIAADYGTDVSPAQLEEIWRSGSRGVRPPTPDASPDGTSMYNPVLKPSPFPPYASPVPSEPRHYSPMNISSISAPERMPYVLPMPVPSRQRSGTWSSAPRDNVPIASLLTEDKNPRDQ
ncbi:hypothetical protein BU24DRAFT_356749 [Aaosphaeria arxii CBS 175.79]|uniref:Myb-like domain-containing protein n=1 Tax=Aaosphaeria arxii CBS 175.79 TaxID=1450172 RepID=A0A6A5XC43_9PLEO|nr:uncharacterized protein BU24DRAFT_356749 [Aaosphaeria arxii CBS 175.79]KAF2010528.1 hypothetical protein BU24DRAFT_356749 [Aaosphaeria arxii CBS 175.79]